MRRKLSSNLRKYGLPFTEVLHGIGDRGGAPRELSVKTVCEDIRKNKVSSVDVIAASTQQVFLDLDALPDEMKNQLPVYNGELVMTDHGVGCYTSRTASKRFNRRCEQLADAAERTSVLAMLLGTDYPQKRLETAWKTTIAHQFHDDITGTSLECCYKRNWNDYILAMNIFAEEYRASAAALSRYIDTSFVSGVPVLVVNPVQSERIETVKADINFETPPEFVRVFDFNGHERASQIVAKDSGHVTVAFSAVVPSCGCTVYDIRPSDKPCGLISNLSVSEKQLENEKYIVTLDNNGDIASVFDKVNNRECLGAPIRMAVFDFDGSALWPAWELEYKELAKAPQSFASRPTFEIIENGAASVAVKVKRTVRGSDVTQVISLSAEGERVDICNEVCWQSLRSLLKSVFTLSVSNPMASYDLGLGVIMRPNSNKKLYEVPAQMWADITAPDNSFGVSILSDSRIGWDKPDDNTLRMTGVYSPREAHRANSHLQDFGINRFSFALCSHSGTPDKLTQLQGAYFNQPLAAFKIAKSFIPVSPTLSLASVSDNGVLIRAVKKAEKSENIVVRVNECEGRAHNKVHLNLFGGIASADAILASEQVVSPATIYDGALVFDIKPYEVKSFMLTPAAVSRPESFLCEPLTLPYNITAFTGDDAETDDELPDESSLPKALKPEYIVCGNIRFYLDDKAVACKGQSLDLPPDTSSVYIVAASFEGDKRCRFELDGSPTELTVQSATEAVGAWDLYALKESGYIKKDTLAWHSTHTHRNSVDERGHQMYFFRYRIDLDGAKTLSLPDDPSIVILAASAVNRYPDAQCASELYDSLEKRNINFSLTPEQQEASVKTRLRGFRYKAKFGLGYARRRLIREIRQII